MSGYTLKTIARIRSDFPTKFGIPRQAGIVSELESLIVFEPEYRAREALRGLEGFSHIWLIWSFSEARRAGFSPTVRPPRLGGNERMGVFATRSPFRPNSLALSCVRLCALRETASEGTVLDIAGADLMDGTPIYDIKPYLPYADSIPDAECGFAPDSGAVLPVRFAREELAAVLPPEKLETLVGLLAQDPRPRYRAPDAEHVYGMLFAQYDVRFTVSDAGVTVTDIAKR